MVPEAARFPGQILVIRRHHPALATRRKGFVLAKAAPRHLAGACRLLPLIRSAKSFSVVLDDKETVLSGERADLSMSQTLSKDAPALWLWSVHEQALRRFNAQAMVLKVHVANRGIAPPERPRNWWQ